MSKSQNSPKPNLLCKYFTCTSFIYTFPIYSSFLVLYILSAQGVRLDCCISDMMKDQNQYFVFLMSTFLRTHLMLKHYFSREWFCPSLFRSMVTFWRKSQLLLEVRHELCCVFLYKLESESALLSLCRDTTRICPYRRTKDRRSARRSSTWWKLELLSRLGRHLISIQHCGPVKYSVFDPENIWTF